MHELKVRKGWVSQTEKGESGREDECGWQGTDYS